MSERLKFRPRKHLRYELYSLTAIVSIPIALVAAFPYSSVAFTASESRPAPAPRCAFVELTEEEEASALAAARAAWKVSAEGVRRMRLDLSIESAPEDPVTSVSDIRDRARPPSAPTVRLDAPALPPTMAAPPPAQIAPWSGEDDGGAFPRRELLQID